MNCTRFVAHLLMAALLYTTAVAQNPVSPNVSGRTKPQLTPEQQKAQQELERKAVLLLEDLVSDAMSLKLTENRIFVLTSAADLLWKRDETRARTLLREAMNQYYSLAQADPQSKEGMFENRVNMRTFLLQLLAGRDTKMALEFLRATRQAPPGSKERSGQLGQDFDKQFELQLAVRMAENDPQSALQIAEDTLSKELNHQVLEIWSSLQRKDPNLANRLSTQIIAKLKNTDLLKGYATSSTAFAMMMDLRQRLKDAQKEPSASSSSSSTASTSGSSVAEMQQTYRELLDLVVTAVLKLTAANLLDIQEQNQARGLLTQTQSLLPEIEKYLPSRAVAVRAKLSQFDKAFYHSTSPQESYEGIQNKSSAELVEMAAKARPEMREFYYRQALTKAIEEGDGERAKQIAKEQFGEAAMLEPVLQQLEEQKIQRAAEQGKFDEARQSVAAMKAEEEKARALVTLAKQAEAKGDQKLQRELLEEARGLLGTQTETRQQVTDQLALATAYLSLEADRSFDILESAIDKLNAVMSALVLLDSFDQGGRFREGEMMMSGADFASGFTDNFDEQILAFARRDFDRTRSALKRWQVNEVRLMVSLMMIEKIIGEQKETRRSFYPPRAFIE